MSSQTINKIRLDLSEELTQEYEKQAEKAGKSLEDYLVQRLQECKDMDSYGGRSLKMSPSERQFCEKIAGKSFKTGAEIAAYVDYLSSLKIGGVSVALSRDILVRMESRAEASRRDFPGYLDETIKTQLQFFVGMR